MSSNLYYDEETLPMLSSGDSMPRARDRDSKKNIRYLVYCLILLAGLLAGFTAGLWKIRVSQTETPSAPEPPPPTILDSYQITNDIAPVHHQVTPGDPKKRAIVTSLYSDGYTLGVTTLGHALDKVNTTARKIVMYLPERLSSYSVCQIEAAGWEMHAVAYVPPPNGGEGVSYFFQDQYTKLRIWTLDQIGIESAVYLDADTLVRRNLDELFDLPYEFAAVPDVYLDARGFTIGFNAGVMALKPDTNIFEDMLKKEAGAQYNREAAEQAYLNLYFGQQVLRLPHIYNGNLAIKVRSRPYWDAMQEQMRVVHYTLTKPFPGRPSCGNDRDCTLAEIHDPVKQREYAERAKGSWGGAFKEEIEEWNTVYEEMLVKTAGICQSPE